jgi:hypothetical protein
MKLHTYEKVILALELFGFVAVLLILWLDEFVDVPYLYFGAPKTPPRPQEYWFETGSVLLLGSVVLISSFWIFRRLRYLEQFVRVCAWCRNVFVNEEWISFEQFMKTRYDVQSTHGICPACHSRASQSSEAARATGL